MYKWQFKSWKICNLLICFMTMKSDGQRDVIGISCRIIKRIYTIFTNFSMQYLVICKVYTGICGKNSYTMFVHLYVR